ncbi:MAG: exo-alpha-sialidase [Acidobacteria bacterium]|nr:exo-alpha-sialidase [Acidobacteriota bacterium]
MILASVLFPLLTLAPNDGGTAWKQPRVAMDGKTAVVAYGAGNDVFAAVSKDAGKTFGKPVLVGNAGVISLGRHRGPRVAISGNSIVISAIAGAQGKGQDGELWAWRSVDGGKTWSSAAKITDVPGAAREGLHTLTAGPKGMVFAAWLDLRNKGTRLMASLSRDGGAAWSPNFAVYESPDGHICECCHPSAAIDADGTIHVMFRNWLGGSRDMWIATSKDNGKSFEAKKVGEGTWVLNACPMDGGDLAVKANREVVTSWRREQKIYWTKGSGEETLVGTGKDSALAVDSSGRTVIVWTEGMRLMAYDGAVYELAPHGGFASVAASPAGVLAAWESGNGISVQRLR